MTSLEHALTALQQALDAPRRHSVWRWLVKQRVSALEAALSGELSRDSGSGLAAREQSLERERAVLLRRLAELGAQVLDAPDVEQVRNGLRRLIGDVERHRRRLNDLVYDSVSMELGGSE
jgi:hypothetical protein